MIRPTQGTRYGVRSLSPVLLALGLLHLSSGRAMAGVGPVEVGANVRPNVRPNVRMNAPQLPRPNGQLGRSAEAVAADPEGENLVAAWETIQGFCGPPFGDPCTPTDPPGITAYGYSTDGGRTWTDAGPPFVVGGAMSGGHPWLDRGGEDGRTFFLVSRARSATTASLMGITVHSGRFDNGTFAWREGHLLSPATAGDYWRSSSVAAAKDGSGAVYVALSNLRRLCGIPNRGTGQIEVVRSADGGHTWERPVVVGPDDTLVTADPKDPRCGTTGTTQIAPSMAAGPHGELYVLWQFGPWVYDYTPGPVATLFETAHTISFRFSRSLDGGRTFSAPRDIAWSYSLGEDPPVGYSKDNINDFPRIALAEDGPHRGRLYVTFPRVTREIGAYPSEQMLASSQVFLVYSDDRGATWSAPVPLGPPVPPTGVKRLWPTVAVEPGGKVDVVYLESQERPAGDFGRERQPDIPPDTACVALLPSGLFRSGRNTSLVDLYWVQSTDGGVTFSWPLRVTSETSDWCRAAYDMGGFLEANYGNYLGIAAARNRTFAVWTDGRSGVTDAYFGAIHSGPAPPASPAPDGARP